MPNIHCVASTILDRSVAIDQTEVILLTSNATSGIFISGPSGVGLVAYVYRSEVVGDKLQESSTQDPARPAVGVNTKAGK